MVVVDYNLLDLEFKLKDDFPYYFVLKEEGNGDFYPSDVIERDGVVLHKKGPYVMGRKPFDLLWGFVNVYSGKGAVHEGICDLSLLERVVDHESAHCSFPEKSEEEIRRLTSTENVIENPYTTVTSY